MCIFYCYCRIMLLNWLNVESNRGHFICGYLRIGWSSDVLVSVLYQRSVKNEASKGTKYFSLDLEIVYFGEYSRILYFNDKIMRSVAEFVTVKVIFNCKYLKKCNLLHLPLPNGEIVKFKRIQVVTVIVHLFSDRDSSATESPQHNPNFTRKEERSRVRSFTYFQSTRISTYNIHPYEILILHTYIYVEMYTYMYCVRWNLMISQFSMWT